MTCAFASVDSAADCLPQRWVDFIQSTEGLTEEGGRICSFFPALLPGLGHIFSGPQTEIYIINFPGSLAFRLELNYTVSFPGSPQLTGIMVL